MGSIFKETILKLLSATNYSLDNLSQDELSSFENLRHLRPLFEWLSQNISDANCVTTEELEEFQELQEAGRVKYGEELDDALQAHLYTDAESSVPFKESLIDAEQELALLKEQLHYKQVLYKDLCSSSAVVSEETTDLKRQLQQAEIGQKEKIKEICAANKKLKDKVAEVQNILNELHDDIVGLTQNTASSGFHTEDGLLTLTTDNIEHNKSSTSVWSYTTGSSWQTIRSTNSDPKYMCQLSLDGYHKVHKQFLKRLAKLIDNLSKAGRVQSSNVEDQLLYLIRGRLEEQMLTLIENEAELEGIQAARNKVKELKRAVENGECLLSRLRYEENELESGDEDDGLSKEDLAMVCQQWADLQAARAAELKQKQSIELSQKIIKKMDEVLSPLMLKLKADKILSEILRYEKERIEVSINLYKSFHLSLQNQYDKAKERIGQMENNLQDYEQFCAVPLEDRNELLEQLATIVQSDRKGVVKAVQNLIESSRREHETMLEHYKQEKNKLVSSGKDLEESSNMVVSRSKNSSGPPANLVESIQHNIDQLDCGIEEVNNYVQEVIFSFNNNKEKV